MTFACSRRALWWIPHVFFWGGGRWKSQDRKIVPLSPYVEKPLNSKVIKSFVPELRSRKCFSCFEIPKFYLYGHLMYVSHIVISWLWYILINWFFFAVLWNSEKEFFYSFLFSVKNRSQTSTRKRQLCIYLQWKFHCVPSYFYFFRRARQVSQNAENYLLTIVISSIS